MNCARPSSTPAPAVTSLFAAFPYIFALTPLSTAFTHFDRGGGLAFDLQTFTPSDLQLFCFLRAAASLPSLCSVFDPPFLHFQQLAASFLQTRGVGAPTQLYLSACFCFGEDLAGEGEELDRGRGLPWDAHRRPALISHVWGTRRTKRVRCDRVAPGVGGQVGFAAGFGKELLDGEVVLDGNLREE